MLALPLPTGTASRRDENLEVLAWLDAHIQQLDDRVAAAADAHPAAQRLMTHPGVGPVTALATALILGPPTRFAGTKQVVSYVGLAPALHASADKYHLGQITKQGNRMLRFLLVQAAHVAARHDSGLKRLYFTLFQRRGYAKAKVAVARKLLVRLYIMLRDEIDYDEFLRRGRAPHEEEVQTTPA